MKSRDWVGLTRGEASRWAGRGRLARGADRTLPPPDKWHYGQWAGGKVPGGAFGPEPDKRRYRKSDE